ncbi:MAG: Do family serine endopeptidase [Candidatus Binatia bacterium]
MRGTASWPIVATLAAVAAASILVHGREGLSPVRRAPLSFAQVAVRSMPAVVNVSSTKMVKLSDLETLALGEDDPLSPGASARKSNARPPEGEPETVEERNIGSGFFISDDGLIVTNHHVVANADKVTVRLARDDLGVEDRQYVAKVVGTDSKTDLALIKIEPREPIPNLSLGDSNRVAVGDWVVAIGNPFGLNQTVTAGIVSATGRLIGQGPYDDFIQTDASINPGSSGGPLLNADGEVVGISVAIVGGPGVSLGIGFATPSNLSREVIDQLRTQHRVVRGWLGTSAQPVTEEIAEAFHLPPDARGRALIADVNPRGPAAAAGIRRGDVIVAFDGHEVRSWRDFPNLVAATTIGREVDARIVRGGEEQVVKVTIAETPREASDAPAPEMTKSSKDPLGAQVKLITPSIARKLGLDDRSGLLVTSVRPGSLADEAGIQPGDAIQEVNQQPIASASDLKEAVNRTEQGQTLLFLVRRSGSTLFLAKKNG